MPRTGPEEGRQYMLKRATLPNLQGDPYSGIKRYIGKNLKDFIGQVGAIKGMW